MRCYGGVDGNEEAAGADTVLQGWSRNSGLLISSLKASRASERAVGRSRPSAASQGLYPNVSNAADTCRTGMLHTNLSQR